MVLKTKANDSVDHLAEELYTNYSRVIFQLVHKICNYTL